MDYRDIAFRDCRQGNEGEMLLFALDRVHHQFAWKTGGLDARQLRQQHPPSRLTLAGLIKHMASVEAHWTARAHGRTPGSPWDSVDWDADGEWDWHSAVSDEPNDLYALWYDTIQRSRQTWAETIANDELAATFAQGSDDYIVSRRRAFVDVLEENLLHAGQASILREAVDGLTGNDPP